MELLISSEMMESMEMGSDESKESEEELRGLPRGMELDCSSCLLQEQMKEGNYELVSKVAFAFLKDKISSIDVVKFNW